MHAPVVQHVAPLTWHIAKDVGIELVQLLLLTIVITWTSRDALVRHTVDCGYVRDHAVDSANIV